MQYDARNTARSSTEPSDPGLAGISEWLLLAVALSLTLVPMVLIWRQLASNFAGGDGKMYLDNIEMYLRFAPTANVIVHNPLDGLWDLAIPMNIWANPGLWPFHFLAVNNAKSSSGAICFIFYAVSLYTLMRSLAVPILHSVVISQFAFISFDPFYHIFGLVSNFALNPTVAIIYGLAFFLATILVRIDDFGARTVVLGTLLTSVILIYSSYCDPLWTVLTFTLMAPPLLVIVLEKPLSPMTFARIVTPLAAFVIVFALGPGRFLLLMSTYTSRYAETAYNVRSQYPANTSMIFSYSQTTYVYLILMLGWVAGLMLARGRARLLAFAAAVCFVVQIIFSAIYIFCDIGWILPIPMYFEHAFSGWLTIGAGIGYAALISRMVARLYPLYRGAPFRAPGSFAICEIGRIARRAFGRAVLAPLSFGNRDLLDYFDRALGSR